MNVNLSGAQVAFAGVLQKPVQLVVGKIVEYIDGTKLISGDVGIGYTFAM